MDPLVIIAVANAIIWTGIISIVLLQMMGQHQEIEGKIDQLERQIATKEKSK